MTMTMNTGNTSGCACGCQNCNNGLLERPRYFPRQLVSATEMNLEQTYFRDRLRRHNRLLHGWGVVCGAQVCVGKGPWKVVVKSGYILGPYGDEIVIDVDQEVDLRTEGVTGICGGSSGPDPWCSQVFVRRQPERVFVAVRYEEVMTRPVRVQPMGCGCEDVPCEYSRWCDGYVIGMVNECPDAQDMRNMRPAAAPAPAAAPVPPAPAAGEDIANLQQALAHIQEELATLKSSLDDRYGRLGNMAYSAGCEVEIALPSCPPCPDSPWVVLAEVQLDPNGTILSIDPCACRRIVVSLAGCVGHCPSTEMRIQDLEVKDLVRGKKTQVTFNGGSIPIDEIPQATFSGAGVTALVTAVTVNSITLDVTVAANAGHGPRTLTLTYADCRTIVKPEAIIVQLKKL